MAIRKRSWKKGAESQTAWVYDWADHSGRRHRRQFKTRHEAGAFRTETENQLRTGAFRPEARKITVRDLAGEYEREIEERNRRGERMTSVHVIGVKGHIRNYILAEPDQIKHLRATKFEQGVGSVKLAQLTPRFIVQFRDRLRAAGVSVVNTRKILSTLHAMLEFATMRDLIALNPARGIKVVGRRDEQAKKIEPPSKELVRALLEVTDENFKVALMLAALTGVRAGEQWALRWRHLDFTSKTVSVETRVDRFGVEDGQGPKSAAGVRSIPLSDALMAELLSLRKRSAFNQAGDLVFARSGCRYIAHADMARRRFKPLFKKLEERRLLDPSLPQPTYFSWHALRHFAISCWIESGLSLKTVQTMAGHSSVQLTMDRYGHMFASENHWTAIEKIAKGVL